MERLKKFFAPMPDDMTSTKYHLKQIERRREPVVDSSVSAARPGISIDYRDSNRPIKLNLEYGRKHVGKIR